MIFPVIEREMALASRSRRTYELRMGVIAIAAIVFVVNMATVQLSKITGTYYFNLIESLLLLYCVAEGVRATSDCLSEEERNGTLGLLFLTRLRGVDVVLGKMAVQATRSFYVFLGLLPLSGLSLILGGVRATDFLLANLHLASFLFFCLSWGLFVSSRSVKETYAGVMTVLGILSACFIAFALDASYSRGPIHVHLRPFDYLRYGAAAPGVWFLTAPALLWVGLAAVLTSQAGRRVEKLRSTLSAKARVRLSKKSMVERVVVTPGVRRDCLETDPIKYLVLRHRTTGMWVGVIGGFTLILGIGIAWVGLETSPLVNLSLCRWSLILLLIFQMSRAVAFCSILRESGSLELILTTPVSPRKLIQGCKAALFRTFLLPLSMAYAGLTIGVMSLFLFRERSGYSYYSQSERSLGSFVVFSIYLLGWYFSSISVAMACGLTERARGTALFKTVFLVFVLPWITHLAPTFVNFELRDLSWASLFGVSVWPIFLIWWGNARTRRTLANWATLGNRANSWRKWFVRKSNK
ncbi:MAG: hypothetical protein JWN25_1237 [Verrucomicrobiales bacterium]|nr:hypothetical protein [Verrucomicrobiales bacterium]